MSGGESTCVEHLLPRVQSDSSCETTATTMTVLAEVPEDGATPRCTPGTGNMVAPGSSSYVSQQTPSFMTQALPKKQPRSPRDKQASPKRARVGSTGAAADPEASEDTSVRLGPQAGLASPSSLLQPVREEQQALQQQQQQQQQGEDGAVFSPVLHSMHGLRNSLEASAHDSVVAAAPAGAAGAAGSSAPEPLGIPGVGAVVSISCVPAAHRWGDQQSPRGVLHHPPPAPNAFAIDQQGGATAAPQQQQQQSVVAAGDDSSSDALEVDAPPVLHLAPPPHLQQQQQQGGQQQQIAMHPHHAKVMVSGTMNHQHHVHALPHPHAHPNHPIIPEALEHELPGLSPLCGAFDGGHSHQHHEEEEGGQDDDGAEVEAAHLNAMTVVATHTNNSSCHLATTTTSSGAAMDATSCMVPVVDQVEDLAAQQQQQQQQQAEELDYMDFDPLLFIKLLPPLEQVVPRHRPLLLPRKTRHCKRQTLVLDLDETLVHSCLEPTACADFTFPVHFNGQEHLIHVRQRPHLHDFMNRVAELYEVVVFTASQKIYAEKLLNIIDPERRLIKHRIFRESCVVVDGNYLKDLSVLGRDLRTTLIVDNSPQAFGFQVDNGVPIESWYEDPSDTELLKLLPFLEALVQSEDVRPAIRSKFRMRELIDRVVC